jgi:hypothetical protein
VISQERLEAIVINALMDGKNAAQIARNTGVPIQRVQATVHRLRGTDPGEANRRTQQKKGQVRRRERNAGPPVIIALSDREGTSCSQCENPIHPGDEIAVAGHSGWSHRDCIPPWTGGQP